MGDALPTVLLVGVDRRTADQLAAVAGEHGLVVAADDAAGPPGVLVVDLGAPDAVGEIRRWRRRDPDLLIAACVSLPERERWEAAERAGADLVVNRGALARSLGRLLAGAGGGSLRRRFPLFDAAEVAGRLGFVRAVADTPVGPVAVHHAGTGLVGVQDTCPHAGATLSEGPVEDGIVTCPRHGSRFSVSTGERVRGPADQGLRTYTVVEDGGRVWLVWT